MKKKDVTLIGAAIIDILTGPVSPRVFETGSMPVKSTVLSFGGDALNEAVVLSRLGKKAELVTLLGCDEAGKRVSDFMAAEGIQEDAVTYCPEYRTGMNIVLVDDGGERFFLTDPESTLRRLAPEHIIPYIEDAADIVCFASMFVSPRLGVPEMEQIFELIKKKPGRVLAADMTKAKNGETLADIAALLPYIDYLIPNEQEIAMLTGTDDPYENARLLTEAGVGCAVIKRGRRGCIVRKGNAVCDIPAYIVEEPADTTGAGDTFAAGFLYGISSGFPVEKAALFANAAASCAVEGVGATAGIASIAGPMERYEALLKMI